MRLSHATAVCLFERLSLDGALAGDLLEERHRGRSAVWYWRQVLIAACIGIGRAIRHHKALAMRAVATGFVIEYFFIFLVGWPDPDLPPFSMMRFLVNSLLVLVTQVATGWVVARTHRACPIPMVFAFLVCFSAWIFGPQLPGHAQMLVDWNQIDPRYRPYFPSFIATVSLTVLSVLLGAALAGPSKAPPVTNQKD